MSLKDTLFSLLGKANPRFLAFAEKQMKNIPGVSQKIEGEYAEIMVELEKSVKPYKNKYDSFTHLKLFKLAGCYFNHREIRVLAQNNLASSNKAARLSFPDKRGFVIPQSILISLSFHAKHLSRSLLYTLVHL